MDERRLIESLLSDGHVNQSQLKMWSDAAGLLAALDAIGREGASAVFKFDGARVDGLVYTVVVSGGRLGETFFRKDSDDFASLLVEAVEFYKTRVWSDSV